MADPRIDEDALVSDLVDLEALLADALAVIAAEGGGHVTYWVHGTEADPTADADVQTIAVAHDMQGTGLGARLLCRARDVGGRESAWLVAELVAKARRHAGDEARRGGVPGFHR